MTAVTISSRNGRADPDTGRDVRTWPVAPCCPDGPRPHGHGRGRRHGAHWPGLGPELRRPSPARPVRGNARVGGHALATVHRPVRLRGHAGRDRRSAPRPAHDVRVDTGGAVLGRHRVPAGTGRRIRCDRGATRGHQSGWRPLAKAYAAPATIPANAATSRPPPAKRVPNAPMRSPGEQLVRRM